MTIETIRVPLGDRSYDVRVGEGLMARAGAEIAPMLPRPRVAVLTDDRVAAAHLAALNEGLDGIEMENGLSNFQAPWGRNDLSN